MEVFLRVLRLSPPLKTNISKFKSDLKRTDKFKRVATHAPWYTVSFTELQYVFSGYLFPDWAACGNPVIFEVYCRNLSIIW